MTTIQLGTPEGDAIENYPGESDESWLAARLERRSCIAVHSICRGFVDIKQTTPSHRALCCRACGLRVTVPNSVETVSALGIHT